MASFDSKSQTLLRHRRFSAGVSFFRHGAIDMPTIRSNETHHFDAGGMLRDVTETTKGLLITRPEPRPITRRRA